MGSDRNKILLCSHCSFVGVLFFSISLQFVGFGQFSLAFFFNLTVVRGIWLAVFFNLTVVRGIWFAPLFNLTVVRGIWLVLFSSFLQSHCSSWDLVSSRKFSLVSLQYVEIAVVCSGCLELMGGEDVNACISSFSAGDGHPGYCDGDPQCTVNYYCCSSMLYHVCFHSAVAVLKETTLHSVGLTRNFNFNVRHAFLCIITLQ